MKKINITGTSVWVDVDQPEPLFGNHIRETWKALKEMFGKKNGERIPFKETEVKRYLNRCIRAWEEKEFRADNLEDSLIAKSYIEALRSVQTALFGKQNS